MTKLEKAMQMEIEGLREKLLKSYCPHNYGMKDRATKSDFMCDSDCKACWNEEIEGITMSNLYLKVKDVQLIETREFDAFSDEPKTVKHWLIKTDFANGDISVKINPENPKIETLDLDEHDEGIRKLLLSICEMSYDGLESAFNTRCLENVLREHTISEIQKMYEDWKKPKVGDEVRYGSHIGMVILRKEILGEKNALVLLRDKGGTTITAPIANMEKTGRYFGEVTVRELGVYAGVREERRDKCHN